LAGAMRGMRLAVFNFLDKRRRHPPAFLSQFDTETGDDRARQPLRVALCRGSAEFEHAIGDHFADIVGILRAVQHRENGVKGLAQEFGIDVVKNGADCHGATHARG
jgi:hypothetical protein